VYGFAGWQLHGHRERLIDPKGSTVRLSRTEYALLTAFLKAPDRTLTREYLLGVTPLLTVLTPSFGRSRLQPVFRPSNRCA